MFHQRKLFTSVRINSYLNGLSIMKWSKTLIAFLLVLTIYPLKASENILILHSYNNGLSWTDNINEGIYENFQNSLYNYAELRSEYMDAKRFQNVPFCDTYKNFLIHKYRNTNIDLIISSDNAAFNFLSMHRNEIFGNIPVVFSGVNYYDSIPVGFTGIIENVNFDDNIKNITNLHPGYNKIYIINDRSHTGQVLTSQFNKIVQAKFPNLKYEYLTNYTLPGLQEKLTTLKPNDIVLLLLFTQDINGYTYSFDKTLEQLTPHCNVPMYGVWDFYLGKGIVGGSILSGRSQGNMAANIAIDILNGKSLDDIPINNGPTNFMFDYKVLKEHNIAKHRLPANSLVINLPYDFILNNKPFFISLLIFLIFLVSLVIALYRKKISLNSSLINEQKLTVEVENARDKAEESNRLKTRFLANISHEVRTPVNAVFGFAELLEDSNTDIEKQNSYIEIIKRSSQQLVDIMDDILSISLIESNQVNYNKGKLSINNTIRELVMSFTKGNKKNKFICDNFTLTDGNDIIQTDKIKFTQVISNLINNANKFTENGIINIGYTILPSSMLEFYVMTRELESTQETIS